MCFFNPSFRKFLFSAKVVSSGSGRLYRVPPEPYYDASVMHSSVSTAVAHVWLCQQELTTRGWVLYVNTKARGKRCRKKRTWWKAPLSWICKRQTNLLSLNRVRFSKHCCTWHDEEEVSLVCSWYNSRVRRYVRLTLTASPGGSI